MSSLNIKRLPYHSAIIPAVVTVVFLLPFINKAFHIDDTLFLASAKQIQSNPVDFYGFSINWYGTELPMAETTKNSPLACYYIALVSAVFGFGEITLHIAFLIPAVAVALGTYYLAAKLCSKPTVAAVAAVLTPAFLVSSTNIMCDTMMLAFWLWATILWMQGIEDNRWSALCAAAVLMALCALTKYFGMALIPLILVYSVVKKRKLEIQVLFLLIPIIILAGYQWLTYELYGRGLLSDAASYATQQNWLKNWLSGGRFFVKGLTVLTFTGGCIITALFYLPLLCSRKNLITITVAVVIAVIFASGFMTKIVKFQKNPQDSTNWIFTVQLILMITSAIIILTIAVIDLYSNRHAESLLLLLWVFGTFIFAGFINWTVNARSLLPMTPAVAILIVRQIDARSKNIQSLWRLVWPLVPAAVITLAVCWADYAWAGTAREAAAVINEKFKTQNKTIWFLGHWGFQYYMEAENHKALDLERPRPVYGDILISPVSNTNVYEISDELVVLDQTLEFMPFRWCATMKRPLGAGFYSDVWGPLPFAFGKAAPEKYRVFTVK